MFSCSVWASSESLTRSTVGFPQEILVDEILAIIYYDGGSIPITLSSLKALDGHEVTLREAILRQLMAINGKQFAQVSDDDVERILSDLQRANGLSREAMLRAFETAGFTQEEGLAELKQQQVVSQVLEVRVKSDKRLIIQRGDVEQYDREHPGYTEASYTLQQACVPYDGNIDREFSDRELAGFQWEPGFDLKESELADDKRFIIDAQIGTIVGRERVAEGLEITRLIAKREKMQIKLDDRYDDVVDILRRERFKKVFGEFQKNLLDHASIWFSHPEQRDEVMAAEAEVA